MKQVMILTTVVSLAANALLASVLVERFSRPETLVRASDPPRSTRQATTHSPSSQPESVDRWLPDDYATWIAQLRKLGIPEASIQTAIILEIHETFRKRLKPLSERLFATHPSWRSYKREATPEIEAAGEEFQRIANEHGNLLNRLFPERSPGSDNPFTDLRSGLRHDRYAFLPAIARERMDQFNDARDQAIRALKKEKSSEAEIAQAVDRLNHDFMRDLAQLASPEQIEDFRLISSPSAGFLGQIWGFPMSDSEKREVLRIKERRNRPDDERAAFERLFGSSRYADFLRSQEPLYRLAWQTAFANGWNEERTQELYRKWSAQAETPHSGPTGTR